MIRTLATTTAAAALLTLTACKGGGASGDAAKLIPDAATVIGGADLQAIMKSPLYDGNKEMLEEGDQKEMMDAAKECNLGPDTWKSVVFGFDPDGGEDKVAVVFVATGLGKKENLECVANKAKEKNGEEPWTMEEKDGKLVLSIDGGDSTGYVVNDDTLAVAGKGWAGAVKELIDGKGKPAVENSLKDVLGRTDMSKAMWAAGVVPASMAKGPADGMKDGAMWIDMSSGLEISGSVGVKDADTATSKATEFKTQFDQAKGMAGMFGIPTTVVDSVTIEAKGEAINVSAKASKEDLEKISASVKKNLGKM